MKRTIITLAVAAMFVLPTVSGVAATNSGQTAKKVVSAVCPVMGNKIPDVSKAAAKSVYKGKTYYFCCKGCKPAFDKDPEKYINKKK